jgi:hypothetical protein
MHEFREESDLPSNAVLPSDLVSILRALVRDDISVKELSPELPDGYATIEAIAEATGRSEDEIEDQLSEIKAARMQAVLNELEAPLHRVERPSPNSTDPLASIMRQRAFETFAQAKPNAQTRKKSTVIKSDGPDWIARAILGALAILGSAVIIMAIVRMIRA